MVVLQSWLQKKKKNNVHLFSIRGCVHVPVAIYKLCVQRNIKTGRYSLLHGEATRSTISVVYGIFRIFFDGFSIFLIGRSILALYMESIAFRFKTLCILIGTTRLRNSWHFSGLALFEAEERVRSTGSTIRRGQPEKSVFLLLEQR